MDKYLNIFSNHLIDHTIKTIQDQLSALGLIPKKSRRSGKQNSSSVVDDNDDTIDNEDSSDDQLMENETSTPPPSQHGPTSAQQSSQQRQRSGIMNYIHVHVTCISACTQDYVQCTCTYGLDSILCIVVEDTSVIVEQLHVNGYSNVLTWLSEYLVNEAEDRELDDEWEEMCIVSQEENQSLAFNDQLFQDLLLSIGLTLPDNQVNRGLS